MKNLFGLLLAFSVLSSCVDKKAESLEACPLIYIVPKLTLKFELKTPMTSDFKLYVDGNEVPRFCPIYQTGCISAVINSGNIFSLVLSYEKAPPEMDIKLTEGASEVVRIEQSDVLPVGLPSTDECVDYSTEYEATLVETP